MPESVYGYWLPPDISTHGAGVDLLINLLHWFMGIIFVGWGVFFAYSLIRFRARPGHQASYRLPEAKVSKYSEIVVVIVEAVLLIGFSIPVWAHVKNDFPSPGENPLRIRVVAQQFAWNFHYPGADGVLGRTNVNLMNADNLIGLDLTDPAARDDVVTNNDFRIPVNRPIICDITSKDVIHSFFIPVMRLKQDAIPGMSIPIWFEATKTGEYQVACAQLCGNNHYTMKADLTVYEEKEFAEWYAYMAPGEGEEEEEEEEDSDQGGAAEAEQDQDEWE
ncbi:MAG: hypothetical protein V3W34_04895 [Phycisphaerae bacterium]